MEEKQQSCCKDGQCCRLGSIAPFILGLVLALAFGWCVFPNLLYSQKEQPVNFNHSQHLNNKENALECSSCHFLRADGSFSGLPATEKCARCHTPGSKPDVSPAEAKLYEYLEQGKEVPWRAHQAQPDNVFFSHAAHSAANCLRCHGSAWSEQDLCTACHLTVPELDKNPAVQENMLTGYSRTTMKMWECERCHANPGHYKETNSNNACYTCHK